MPVPTRLPAIATAVAALEGKLQPPRLAHDCVPRGKLREALQHDPHWRILLLRAPAGYGKTTLMGQLFADLEKKPGTSCYWLTLDPGDNDPQHLLIHLQACIDRPWSSQPSSVALHAPDLGSWLSTVESLPGLHVLFLDELESVQEQLPVQLIHQLLRFAPDNLRIVAGTRPHARLALHRMKASGRLLEWDVRHLRFDDDEARALLRQGHGAHDPAPWLELVAQRCEGWPAALRLSALALRHGEAAPRLPGKTVVASWPRMSSRERPARVQKASLTRMNRPSGPLT